MRLPIYRQIGGLLMNSHALITTTIELGVKARRTQLAYQNTSGKNNLVKLRELMNAGKNKEAEELRSSFSTTEKDKLQAYEAYETAFAKLVEHLKTRLNQSVQSLAQECYDNACDDSKDEDESFQQALETQITKHLHIKIVEKKSNTEDTHRPDIPTTRVLPSFSPQPSKLQLVLPRVTFFEEGDNTKTMGIREFIGKKASQLMAGYASQKTAFIDYDESEGLQFHFQNGQYAQALDAKLEKKSYRFKRCPSRLENKYGTFASYIVFREDQIERFLQEELRLDEQNINRLYEAYKDNGIYIPRPQRSIRDASQAPTSSKRRGGCTIL